MAMATDQRHFPSRHYGGRASGPFESLNPTRRRHTLRVPKPDTPSSGEDSQVKAATAEDGEVRAEDAERQWRSRDNRKGKLIISRCRRHALVIVPESDNNAKYLTPPPTNTSKAILKGIWRMFSKCPYWDVSYLVATIFTLGSVVWVINAFYAWLPLVDPSTAFPNEGTLGGGITAFIGATIFEFGSVLLMIEAINEDTSDCFGWALEEVLEENGMWRIKPAGCSHHHRNKGNFVGKGKVEDEPTHEMNEPNSKEARKFIWFPTWHELRTHYFKELGFLACLSQMIGATVFWIAGFTALPPIFNRLTSTAAQNGAYWLPQVIGGTGFIVSGTFFMLETQRKWYIPAPKVLGWHIAVWNLIGGIGFTLCGALGFASANSGAVYEASLATFWGSWCFLIGSVIQWYESLDKHPVEVETSGELAAKEQQAS